MKAFAAPTPDASMLQAENFKNSISYNMIETFLSLRHWKKKFINLQMVIDRYFPDQWNKANHVWGT